MKRLHDIEHLEGVRVLVRVDFNEPVRDGKVSDDFRIRTAVPTIGFLRSKGAKVILVSHMEAIDGGNASLEPMADVLRRMGMPITFIHNIKDARPIIDEVMKNGECVLIENIRSFGEGEKSNDQAFAKELASLADIYVNEAFSASHREHASIVSVPKYLPSYAGLQMEKEISNLSRAFNPPHPFAFILGGAKFETKLPLLKKFMDIADIVFVGGALASDFYKQKGYEVGRSLVSSGSLDLSSFLSNPKLLLPEDILNEQNDTKRANALSSEDKIVDAGNQTLGTLKEKISTAKFILWNGPLGLYEGGYKNATLELAAMVSEATLRGAETIVGGGDTLAAIAALHVEDKFTFISTGGGAMLDFLAKGTLPGIEALEKAE